MPVYMEEGMGNITYSCGHRKKGSEWGSQHGVSYLCPKCQKRKDKQEKPAGSKCIPRLPATH